MASEEEVQEEEEQEERQEEEQEKEQEKEQASTARGEKEWRVALPLEEVGWVEM